MSQKALLIAQYCTMEKSESTVEKYLRYKANIAKVRRQQQLKSKGGYIKCEMIERHYLNNVEGINANVINKIQGINNHNSKKVEKYIMTKVASSPSMANRFC